MLSAAEKRQLEEYLSPANKTKRIQIYLAECLIAASEINAAYFEWYWNATQFYKQILESDTIE
jgi:hypothetical protein